MQPIDSIETISHSSNLDSKNTRQTKQLTRWFVYRSSESPPVIPTSPLRKLLSFRRQSGSLSQGQLQAGSLSTAFLTSLALASFHLEAKRTFTNFLKTHHTLGSSRATPSRLGGFTSKCNKWHKDCFTKIKCSSAHKEDSPNPPLRISHKSQDPRKEGLGRAHKGLGWMYFMGSTSTHQRRERKSFYICPPKN
jgi:hypothetical protein